MSVEITKNFVDMYSANLDTLLRQRGSKLRAFVTVEMIKGKQAFFDQIGKVASNGKNSRHEDIKYSNTEHARRMVTTALRYASDLIDGDDKIRMLTDPSSEYAAAQADALGADLDDIILTAMLGTAYTGTTGGTQVSFDSTNMKVANNVREAGVSDAAYGLNVAKLRRAKAIFDKYEVPKEERFVGVNAAAMESLLGTTKATSADYNMVKSLVQGDMDTFVGFKFVDTQRIQNDGTYDKIPFWHKRGCKLALGQDLRVDMTYVKTKVGQPLQVYSDIDMGATRMQEPMIGYIECKADAGPGG